MVMLPAEIGQTRGEVRLADSNGVSLLEKRHLGDSQMNIPKRLGVQRRDLGWEFRNGSPKHMAGD